MSARNIEAVTLKLAKSKLINFYNGDMMPWITGGAYVVDYVAYIYDVPSVVVWGMIEEQYDKYRHMSILTADQKIDLIDQRIEEEEKQ